MLMQAGLKQLDVSESPAPIALFASKKGRGMYEKNGFISITDFELVEPTNEFGEAVETKYSWTFMRRNAEGLMKEKRLAEEV